MFPTDCRAFASCCISSSASSTRWFGRTVKQWSTSEQGLHRCPILKFNSSFIFVFGFYSQSILICLVAYCSGYWYVCYVLQVTYSGDRNERWFYSDSAVAFVTHPERRLPPFVFAAEFRTTVTAGRFLSPLLLAVRSHALPVEVPAGALPHQIDGSGRSRVTQDYVRAPAHRPWSHCPIISNSWLISFLSSC